MTDLLKNVGKAEVYKDGKVSNTTIYDLAKILFKLDELSSDQLQVMRNLYMLRWRTVNLAQYREIACFNMDEVTEDRTIDTLLYLESRGYFENSQSDASNREIYLHSIVAELIDKDYETTVCDCIEIAKYYQSQIKNVLSNNDKSVYAQYKQQAYIELIFEFYKSLNINYKSNVEYIIDSIYVSCVKTFKSNSNMVPFVHEVFYDKIFTESVNPSDETINMKLANVHIWFTLESICSGYFGDCLNVWEEPAFDAIAAMHNYCLSNPNDKNINFFVEEVILFSQYLKSLYQSGRLKELLGFSTWTFNEEAFLKIQEYIDSLSNYMTPKQKKICEVYFSHNLKQIIKAVKVLPEIVVRESQENSNSSFRTYARATFRKQKNILPTIMEDNNLSLNRKIELVKLYYSRCVDSFHGFMHFGERWNSELEDKKNKYNFLKDFLSNYGDSLDESNDCLNYIRWMFACLSLNYNIEEFHENMKIIMKQLKEISNQKVYSLKDFLNIWTPFEPPYDLFECETINPKLISEHILPYIKYYLSFCESLLDSKGINKNEWYGSVCINLKNYAQQHGSVFLTLFKEYEAKYHNCLGIDYTLTKNQ